MILTIGSLFGFVSVAFGAFAEHGLKPNITEESFRFVMTAIRYNQIHAVLISAIGLALTCSDKLMPISWIHWSAWLFIAGIILFSFSIYLAVSLNIPALLKITPIGGITIMIAWLFLLVGSFWLK